MDMIIRNGTVVNATGSYRADVAVKDGKIAAVGCIPDMPGVKVVDAAGKLVLPGAIDAHTHLAMPFGGTVSSDDYFAGTRAAACGGTTTVFDFALQDFNETMTQTFERRNALAAPDAAVDYSFHIGVKDIHGELLDSIKDAELLRCYFENDCSVKEVADIFGVHRNTVNYKLKQIREMLGSEFSDEDKMNLLLAFRAQELLNTENTKVIMEDEPYECN